MSNINLDMFKDAFEAVKEYIDKQEELLIEVCEKIKSMFSDNIKSTDINSIPEVATQYNGRPFVSAKTSLIITLKDDKQILEEFKDSINMDLVISQLSFKIISILTGKPQMQTISLMSKELLPLNEKLINLAKNTNPIVSDILQQNTLYQGINPVLRKNQD